MCIKYEQNTNLCIETLQKKLYMFLYISEITEVSLNIYISEYSYFNT